MMPGTVLSLVSGTVAVLLSLMFAQSVASKAADIDAFIATIGAYQLVPTAAGRFVAHGLVAAESFAILGILAPPSRPAGALLAITLFLGYAIAMAVNLSRGRHEIDCGCGGPPQPISSVLVRRNVLLAAMALPLLTVPATALALTEITLVGACGVTLWLGCTVAGQLQANSAHIRRRRKG